MRDQLLELWMHAFFLSVLLEVPIFVAVARWGGTKEKTAPIWRQALAGAIGTCITHPLLWFVWSLCIRDYNTYIISGELLVAVIETFTFFAIARPIKLSRAMAASFIANAVSFGGGLLLRAIG